jgi:GH25 family lysozyme M1 (1,4-beta-N-acetylmuramidase)
MSRTLRRRLTGVAAVATALALSAGVSAVLAGVGTTPALRSAASPRHLLDSASHALTVDPGPLPSVPGTQAPGSGPSTPPTVTQTPPPVADGVARTNVASAHSPQTLTLLSSSPAAIPPPADAGALGVDVADYQHPKGAAIDWSRVAAAGYKFAFIKATEGDYYKNPYYASDLAEAKAAGLYATGYHFAVPNVSGGASQADYAVQNGAYTADGRTLPLALDIEYNPYGAECYGLSAAAMVSWLAAFASEARRLTGQLPIIYTTADWWHTCTGDSTTFGADPLWVAGYGDGSPPMPAGWANWTFWQYTSHGTVPGISGDVDVSYFLSGAVRLLDPGSQQDGPGTGIQLQVTSLNAAAGQSPVFTASGLPPGLAINGDGLITGTISSTAAGIYGVTVTAANPSGGGGTVSFTWTVTASQPSPTPSASASPTPSASASPSPSASSSASPAPSSPGSPSPSATPAVSPSASSPGSAPAAATPASSVTGAAPSASG